MKTRPTHATELGAIVELQVAEKLIARGCEVFRSLVSSSEIDLVAIALDGTPQRIQVKQATLESKGNGKAKSLDLIPSRYPNKNRDLKHYTKIDFFVAKDGFDFYVIPSGECAGMRRFGLHSRPQYRNAWHLIVGKEPDQLPAALDEDHQRDMWESA